MVIRTWVTLFLSRSVSKDLIFRHYNFAFNVTHAAVPLNYGSILNHHESANMRLNNMNLYVRGIFNVEIVTIFKEYT